MVRIRLIIAVALCTLMMSTIATAAETTSYTYDVHGRLIKVQTSSGRTTEYTYDAANNRIQVTSTGGLSGKIVVLPLIGGLVLPLP